MEFACFQRPIGARAKRTAQPKVVLTSKNSGNVVSGAVIESLDDLNDYTNPRSACALLKACVAFATSLPSTSEKALSEILEEV